MVQLCHKNAESFVYRIDMNTKEFNSVMKLLRQRLLNKARQLSGNDDVAEDLVQETLIGLWQMRQELERHPNVEALALTIVRNKWTDYWRREQRMQNGDLRIERQTTGTDIREDIELIKQIVDSLPPLQQQIFRLKEMEGYEKEEICQITGCSEESLRQNLSRARRRIRELFIKLNNT